MGYRCGYAQPEWACELASGHDGPHQATVFAERLEDKMRRERLERERLAALAERGEDA